MKKISMALAASLSLFGSHVHAVSGGSDVSASDYDDYVVRIVVGDETCGAMIIGGSYLLSAEHCFYTNNRELQDTSVTIYQGVDFNTDNSTTVSFSVILNGQDTSLKTSMLAKAEAIFDPIVKAAYPTVDGALGLAHMWSGNDPDLAIFGDMVLVKLNIPIPTSSGAIIGRAYDMTTSTSNLPAQTTITFRGWGVDENGDSPVVMQSLQIENLIDWIETESHDNQVYPEYHGLSLSKPCDDSNDSTCSWYGSDTIKYYGLDGAMIKSGDSGTPLIYNNTSYGLVSSGLSGESSFTHFSLSMTEIAAVIDDVVYPYGAGAEITPGSSSTQNIVVPVQNFTANDVLLTPTLNDSTGLFSADVSACNTTLSSTEGCLIQVTFNETNQPISSAQSASVSMGTFSIPLTVSIATASDSTSGSSGGGSLGFLSLLSLLGLCFYRSR